MPFGAFLHRAGAVLPVAMRVPMLRRCSSSLCPRCCGAAPARRPELQSGPRYTPRGNIAPVIAGGLKSAGPWDMDAQFRIDNAHGIFAGCGEIHQDIKWDAAAQCRGGDTRKCDARCEPSLHAQLRRHPGRLARGDASHQLGRGRWRHRGGARVSAEGLLWLPGHLRDVRQPEPERPE
jgi:hypothetical protein